MMPVLQAIDPMDLTAINAGEIMNKSVVVSTRERTKIGSYPIYAAAFTH